ncbi:hypothetical protein AAL_01060 [Moelleriella libera RCEF 2490]|uniref:Rhodopsin domain-containing protein n=1 Tax=Moelleriella libera RCEF 2490 TaxID=1081109 RepID=A0A166RS67_9HYPO|nr:hypothetical protein AAL_01060 [Moelleriella libera RCEF 2490]
MSNSSAVSLIPPPVDINDTHKVYGVAVAVIVMCSVTTCIGVIRLVFRWRHKLLGLDDYAFVPALLFYWGWSIMSIYVNLCAGVGKPLWEITLGEFSIWFKGIIGSMWLYPAMTFWVRVSILLFYRRIFAIPGLAFDLVVKGLLVLQAVYLVVFCVLPAFVGHPLHKLWSPLERGQHMNDYYYYTTQVALYSTSLALDAILLALPLWPLATLRMPLHRRLGTAVIFIMGAAASIVAAYKLAVFVVEFSRFTDIDPQWLGYEMSRLVPPQFDHYGKTFWIPSQVEPTVALVGASLPALRAAFKAAKPQLSRTWASLTRKTATTENSGGFSSSGHISCNVPSRGITDTARDLKLAERSKAPNNRYIPLETWGKA